MTAIFMAAAVAFASFVNGLTGFGFVIVVMPALLAMIDAKSAVILCLMLALVLQSTLVWRSRGDVDRKLLATLLLSSFLGMPFGVYVLIVIDESLLRLAIGSTIVLIALLLLLNYQRRFAHERRAAIAVGIMGGLLSSSVTVVGPFIVLFLANQGVPQRRLRATIAAFLLGVSFPSLLLLSPSGLITRDLLVTALLLTPASLVGYALALPLLSRVKPELFRQVTVVLVGFAGAGIVLGEVRRLLGF